MKVGGVFGLLLFLLEKKMEKKKRKMYKHGGSHDGNALAKRNQKSQGGRMMYKDGGMPKAKPC